MRRWPSVTLPARIPNTSKSTTSPSNRHRRRCSGRTQRWVISPSPNFIDLGQGKAFITSGIASAITSAVVRPGFSMMATQNVPFLSSRCSHWSSEATPAPRRKPSMAFSGASTRGPLRSSRTSSVFTGRPSITRPRRRGPAKVVSEDQASPAAFSFSPSSFSRSASARGCIRAGISSQKISNSNSDIVSSVTRSIPGRSSVPSARNSCRPAGLHRSACHPRRPSSPAPTSPRYGPPAAA